MDDAGGRGDGGSGGYPEWWSAGHLAQQVGSLSKELSEMKGLLSKQGLDDEANVSGILRRGKYRLTRCRIFCG